MAKKKQKRKIRKSSLKFIVAVRDELGETNIFEFPTAADARMLVCEVEDHGMTTFVGWMRK